MKRIILLAAFGLMAGAASLFAQAPQGAAGEPGDLPKFEMPVVLNPEEKTAQMAEKYSLTDEQKAALLELNQEYDGKLEFRMPEQTEQRDFRKMTDAEREEFFSKMMDQMADMQEKQQQMEKDQKAYDNAIKDIFDKKQLKAYRADRRKAEVERQRAMQQNGFRGGMPGGGFPGGGPGGFPGGGFPGGGFPGGF